MYKIQSVYSTTTQCNIHLNWRNSLEWNKKAKFTGNFFSFPLRLPFLNGNLLLLLYQDQMKSRSVKGKWNPFIETSLCKRAIGNSMYLPCPLFDCIVPIHVEFKIQILFDQFLSKSMFCYHLSLCFAHFVQFAIPHTLVDALVVVSFSFCSRALTILLDFHFYANDVINKTLAMSSTLFVLFCFSYSVVGVRLVKHWKHKFYLHRLEWANKQ